MSTTVVQKQAQDNIETPGAKCNRCFYDILWDKENAIKQFGKNRPYAPDHQTPHSCEVDSQGLIVTRPGYGLIDGKVKCLRPPKPADQQQKQLVQSMGPNGVDLFAIESLIKEQISQLSQHYMAFHEEYKKIVQTQSQEILTLKGIITSYIEHNPTEGVLKTLISELIRYLPEPALRPRSAAELKESLLSLQKTPETSSGYTRGEYQNQFSNEKEAGFESTE
jgi:hypothetical protein